MERFKVLDGWRGISIICVLLGHLFPLGPKILRLNEAIATTGMVLFFILSGFLITNIIIKDSDPINFLIKRITRIIPLAWMTLIITLWLTKASSHEWLSSMLFYANLPPFGLKDITSHFWSLCVEVQFYFLTAFFYSFSKRKHSIYSRFWLFLLPEIEYSTKKPFQ